MISGVILAGGNSSRMGRDKARLKVDGVSFVEKIRSEIEETFAELLLSVKSAEDFPEVTLPHMTDIYPGCGPMSGIHSALHHSAGDYVFVVACDMPFVKKKTIMELIHFLEDSAQETNRCYDAVIPVAEDGRLHVLCALYHKRCLETFEHLLQEGNYRMRSALGALHVRYVPVAAFTDHENVFANINTQEEYEMRCGDGGSRDSNRFDRRVFEYGEDDIFRKINSGTES